MKADFEKLWSMYPRKKGKQATYKSYVKAIKQGTTNKQIQDGIQALIKEAKTNGTKPQFLPHGSTGLISKAG